MLGNKLDAAIFANQYSNLIMDTVLIRGTGTAADPRVFQTLNTERARITGIEVKGIYDWGPIAGGRVSTPFSWGRAKGGKQKVVEKKRVVSVDGERRKKDVEPGEAEDRLVVDREGARLENVNALPWQTLVMREDGVASIGEGIAIVKKEGGGVTVKERIADSPEPVRLGGVGNVLRAQLEPMLGCEVRTTILGHVQRGGPPTPFDRVLATQYGHAAAQLVAQRQFNRVVVLRGTQIESVPLAEVAGRSRNVPADHPLLRTASDTGISFGR